MAECDAGCQTPWGLTLWGQTPVGQTPVGRELPLGLRVQAFIRDNK